MAAPVVKEPQPDVTPLAPQFAGLAGGTKLRVKPNAPFFLFYWKNRTGSWSAQTEGFDKPVWLPSMQPFRIVPGGLGVRTLDKREAEEAPENAWYSAMQNHERRGAKVLLPFNVGGLEGLPPVPDEFVPDYRKGQGPQAYVTSTPCTGGAYWHLLWDEPRQPLANAEMQPKHHAALYHRWLAWLVQQGYVQPPQDGVLEVAVSDAENRAQAVQVASAADPDDVRDRRLAKADTRAKRVREAVLPTELTDKAAPRSGRAA